MLLIKVPIKLLNYEGKILFEKLDRRINFQNYKNKIYTGKKINYTCDYNLENVSRGVVLGWGCFVARDRAVGRVAAHATAPSKKAARRIISDPFTAIQLFS